MRAAALNAVRGLGVATGDVVMLVDRPARMVARVDTGRGPVVVKCNTDKAMVEREYAANRRLAAAGLPVADVLAVGDGVPAYLVLTWLDGVALSSASPEPALHEAGALLRRVHALGGDGRQHGELTWDAWMAGWLNAALGWWRGYADPGPERIASVWQRFARLRPLLATRGNELMLFDGRPDHILVTGDRISGLIDLSECRPGDAAMDLAVLGVTDPDLPQAVLGGYAPTDGERRVFAELVPFYLFLRRLAAAEFNLSHGDPALAARALSLIG